MHVNCVLTERSSSIWLIFLANGFRLSILYSLTPFVTSDFQSHSLLTVIGIVSDAMTSAVYIPMAKLLDIWGRAEGFLLMVGFSTLGVILMAVSKNLATFCAAQASSKSPYVFYCLLTLPFCTFLTFRPAQVFYSIGFAGIIYIVGVLAADATSLKNRGLAFAFTSSPYMITAFAGSKAAEGFLENVSWRWGFGCFAIIIPAVTLPLFVNLKLSLRKAEKSGIFAKEKSGRTLVENIWFGIVQFDGKYKRRATSK